MEPWDASGYYYPAGLFLSGLLVGYLAPRRWLAAGWCVFLGQLLVFAGRNLADPGNAGLWPLGAVVLLAYSILSLAGARLGAVAGARRAGPGREV